MLAAVAVSVFAQERPRGQEPDPATLRKEKYRPQYHFSPARGWIGDPDGLVYNDGLFHLFWWGHAVSPDLVHWKEMPYPMKGGDRSFSYFSGSVAVDHENDAGFGAGSMLAFWTKHFPGDTLPETQALSVSTDDGVEFHYYKKNPVLDIGQIFFRDPQVFRYEPDGKWKMVISLPDKQVIHIYESDNLLDWSYCSAFGGMGARNSFWECPELFELPVAGGNGAKKWVMMIGRGPNRVQYFTGDFDGREFTPDEAMARYLLDGERLEGVLFEDFERADNWNKSGVAFTMKAAPTAITDYLGKSFAGNLSDPRATGEMTSQPFIISHNAINFLAAGHNKPDSLMICLIVDGKVVRSTTGDNPKVFKWNGWDVTEFRGRQASIRVIDNDPQGVIAIDHVVFSDVLTDQRQEHALWLDFGNDYYATRVWRNYDPSADWGDKVYAIGWMGNWEYANRAPTTWGRGFQSVPRTMALKEAPYGYVIVQQPVEQLRMLRGKERTAKNIKVQGTQPLKAFRPAKNVYEMVIEFEPSPGAEFGLNLLVWEGRKLPLVYNSNTSSITLDRTDCTDHVANELFTRDFAKKMNAPVKMSGGSLRLHILVDQASVEVFTGDGDVVLSAITFPSEKQTGIEVFSNNGATTITTLSAWELDTIWEENKK